MNATSKILNTLSIDTTTFKHSNDIYRGSFCEKMIYMC